MNSAVVKNLLLKSDCFIKNDYFELYIKLVTENLYTKKVKHITNMHHVIPLMYFTTSLNKDRRAAEKDSVAFGNIKINLRFSDHIKAHYYVALCVADKYKFKAICALQYLIGNYNSKNPSYDTDFKLDDLQLTECQKLYEEGSALNSAAHTGLKQNRSADWNLKISLGNTGKKKIHLDDVEKAVDENELSTYLAAGWVLGPKPYSEERKIKARESAKIASEKARSINTGDNNPAKRPDVRKKLSEAAKGKTVSEETRQKISEAMRAQKRGKNIVINGITYYGYREAMQALHLSYYDIKKLIGE